MARVDRPWRLLAPRVAVIPGSRPDAARRYTEDAARAIDAEVAQWRNHPSHRRVAAAAARLASRPDAALHRGCRPGRRRGGGVMAHQPSHRRVAVAAARLASRPDAARRYTEDAARAVDAEVA
jgi:hypothetical protein